MSRSVGEPAALAPIGLSEAGTLLRQSQIFRDARTRLGCCVNLQRATRTDDVPKATLTT